jgi:acetyltransferase
MQTLSPLFSPRSIALVGATGDVAKLSCVVLKNLLRFKGRVYPVTPAAPEVLGLRAYTSPAALPETVDLSLIMLPAAEVAEVLAAHRGRARCCAIVSAGFAEVGEAGLQDEVGAIGRELGIRLLGPNCLGIFNPQLRLDTFFLPPGRMRRPKAGSVAVVSQSGAILTLLLEALAARGVGVSKALNYGNAVDIDAPEVFDYLADDADTEVVIAYLESVADGRLFAAAARRLAGRKSFVLLKAGQGTGGGAAAFSHTGRLAGRYEVFRSVMAQLGLCEAQGLEELLDAAHALTRGRPQPGSRVCIVTNAGGPGVLAADECARQGLELPTLPAAVREGLRRVFPPFYAVANPTDLTGQVRDEDYRTALSAVRDHYDGFLVIALVGVPGVSDQLAEILAGFRRSTDKPLVSCVTQGVVARRLIPRLEKSGVPVFPSPERAVRALRVLLTGAAGTAADTWTAAGHGAAAERLRAFLAERPDQHTFLEPEVKGLLRGLGLAVPRGCFLLSGSPPSVPPGLSFPLVAKVASRCIAAKSEVGGVRTGITDRRQLAAAMAALARILGEEGVLVEEQAPAGVEVIVGGVIDPQFGPVVMFGLGGFLVEFFRDVSFALAPVCRDEALRLVERTRGSELFAGFRGRPPVDREALASVIATVSELIGSGLLAEIDLNPVALYPSGALVLDAKMKRA